jgi:hypothetical protein
MNDEHINDELSQRLALHDIIPADAAAHIKACGVCGSKVQQYVALNKELQQLPKAAFDFDTAALVPTALRPKRHFPWFRLLIASVILIGLMLVTIGFASLGRSNTGLLLPAAAVPVLAAVVIFTILQHLSRWRLLSHI